MSPLPQAQAIAASQAALDASLAAEATATATAGSQTGAALAARAGVGSTVVLLTAGLWFLFDSALGAANRALGNKAQSGGTINQIDENQALLGESAARAVKAGFSSNLSALSKLDATATPISKVSVNVETQHQVDPLQTNFGVGNFPTIQQSRQSQKNKAPSLPPRRLSSNKQVKQSALNPPTAPSNASQLAWIPAQQTIQSVGTMEYGILSHNPVSATKVNVPVYDTQQVQRNIQSKQRANIREFSNYVSKSSNTMDLHEINILNMDLPDAKGNIKPVQIVGASVTKAIAQQYHERSKGATKFPNISTAPLKIGATVIPVAVGIGLASNPAARTAIKNSAIQAKNLGSKIPGEFNKIKAALDLNKLMQIITTAGVIHNAAMLSNDLLGSCVQVVDNVMALVGIKNTDGSAFDTSKLVGQTVKNFIVSIVGAKTYADVKRKFAAYNAVYTSVTNAVNTIQNLQQTMVNVLEIGTNYTGRIGNALMRHNIIPVGAFRWMDEQVEVENKRLNKLTNALASSVDIASDFASISGDLVSIKDTVKQLQDDKNAIVKSATDAEKVFLASDTAKDKASNPPVIKPEDE